MYTAIGSTSVLELSGTTIRIVETTTGSTTMKSTALRCNQLLLKTATRFLVDCRTHDLARAIAVSETGTSNAAVRAHIFEPIKLSLMKSLLAICIQLSPPVFVDCTHEVLPEC
jgi:hypothetical protein